MELVTKLGRSQYGVPSANTIFRSFRSGSLRDSRPKPCRQEPWSKSSGNNSGANWAHSSTNARMRSASCQFSSYCWRIMGMTICLAPRGACGGGVFRSRFTCRVFGRASILASPSLERRRMTKMPPDGYPAFQYLQSVGVSNVNASGLARPISSGEQGLSCFGAGQGESADFRKLEEGCGPCLPTGVLIRGLGTGAAKLAEVRRKELFDLRLVLLGPGRFAMFPLVLGEACGRQVFALLDQSRVHARDLLEGFDRSTLPIR